MKLKRKGCAMDYTKYMKSFSGVNSARLALWAALLFVVLVVGIAVLNSGRPENSRRVVVRPVALCQGAG